MGLGLDHLATLHNTTGRHVASTNSAFSIFKDEALKLSCLPVDRQLHHIRTVHGRTVEQVFTVLHECDTQAKRRMAHECLQKCLQLYMHCENEYSFCLVIQYACSVRQIYQNALVQHPLRIDSIWIQF
jgi:hypothetical protein